MKKIIVFIIAFILMINVDASDKYTGDYTIEYLLKNYNVVSLGMKEKYKYSINNNDGNVSYIFDIGGPVLINGDYIGNSKYENEFAQKNNNIPSYINGNISNIKPGSKESHDNTKIYINSKSKLNNKYNYEIINNNNYLDFSSLYSSIVNEQKYIDNGKTLKLEKVSKLENSINSYAYEVNITKYGNYLLNDINKVSKVKISKYNPNELYVITSLEEFIYLYPVLEIDDIKNNYSNKQLNVYCGRIDKKELCTSNIIWNFPNARYIYTNYSTKGHIVAPKADIELVESNYQGTLIANSITSKKDNYTSIEYYPYNLKRNIVTTKNVSCIKEDKEISNDIYDGKYSIDELLKNYNVVTLGQKNNKKSKVSSGSVSTFHIAGNFLINGDLGKKDVVYKKQHKDDHNGIRLDLKTNNENYHSYIKGNLLSDAFDSELESKYTFGWQKVVGFTIKPYIFVNKNKISDWTNTDHTKFINDNKIHYNDYSRKSYYQLYLGPKIENNNYSLETMHSVFKSDNYIDFKKLYDSIVNQQKSIANGKRVSPDVKGIVRVEIGGNYTINNIKDVERIAIDNYNEVNNQDKLTIITINDSGTVNIPKFSTSTYNGTPTNAWFGKKTPSYTKEKLQKEVYYGNIVWNFPNASKVVLPLGLSFKGHIIAPNADVETPEIQVAGCIIANSLYSKGYTDIQYYPLTVGSVGMGISTKEEIGNCNPETKNIKGSIKWYGTNAPRVKINLVANGKIVDTTNVSKKDNWKYEFENVNVRDEYGKYITYEITEEPLDNYIVEIKGFEVINTYQKDKTFINVYNTWIDESDVDKLRPNSIIMNIYKNKKKYKTIELKGYTHTFNINNKDNIKIKVNKINKYKTSIEKYEFTFIIKNKHNVKIKKENKFSINIDKKYIPMILSIFTISIVIIIIVVIKIKDKK